MPLFIQNRLQLIVSLFLVLGISCKKKAEDKLCNNTNLAEVKGCKLYSISYLSSDSPSGGETYLGQNAFHIENNFYTKAPGYYMPKTGIDFPFQYDACNNYISSMDRHWYDTWRRDGIDWRKVYDYSDRKLWRIRFYDNVSTPDSFVLNSTEEITYGPNYCVAITKDMDGVITNVDTGFFNNFKDIIKLVRYTQTYSSTAYYLIDTSTLNPYSMVPNYETTLPRSKHITLATYWDNNGILELQDSLYEYTKTTSGYLKSEVRYYNFGSGTRKAQNVYEYKDCY